MDFPKQAAYDAFIDQTARDALETWRRRNGLGGDGQDEAQEQIANAAAAAVSDRKAAGQVIQFFRGGDGDVVVGLVAGHDQIWAHAVAMVECDARDLMWRLRGDAAWAGRRLDGGAAADVPGERPRRTRQRRVAP